MAARNARVAGLALAGTLLAAGSTAALEPPRLVLVLVVDQLRRDRLDPELPGGLGRLVREGHTYPEGVLDHAITATCPGHVSISSGRHPGRAGVPGNSFTDRVTGESVYCVEDPSPDARVLGGDQGRSPALLRTDTLGDWLKRSRPEARVFAVAGKDRAAITLAGQAPDGAYWYARDRGFTTSRHYRERLPDWVEAFNEDLPRRVPETWIHTPGMVLSERADDYGAESPDYSRTSPHPIAADSREGLLDNLYFTPFLDAVTLDLASELVAREGLGQDETPDLLALGLSATDAVGHLYGPESHEGRDALLRLDAALAGFLETLEERVGRGRLLVALSADHGVLPLPEWLAETGRLSCATEGGRNGVRGMALRLTWKLHMSVGGLLSLPRQWVKISGAGITVDRPLAARHEVAVDEVVRTTKAWLEEHPSVRRAWTQQEIRDGQDDLARLYRNSLDPERSADLAIQVEPTCLIAAWDHGTGHGSPYLYDRAVPIVFYGSRVPAGSSDGPARTIDIAPTLAKLLGIPTPDDLDGRPLF